MPFCSLFLSSPEITQPCPQVFSINGSITCDGQHFWCHFDVKLMSLIQNDKVLSKFTQQLLVMVNYECGFNQSETGKYFEWIILTLIHRSGGKYPLLSPTLLKVNNCFTIYHTSWITSSPKSNFICDNILTKAILFFFSHSEVNSTWLITSELANQCARKVLFTSVVYTK